RSGAGGAGGGRDGALVRGDHASDSGAGADSVVEHLVRLQPGFQDRAHSVCVFLRHLPQLAHGREERRLVPYPRDEILCTRPNRPSSTFRSSTVCRRASCPESSTPTPTSSSRERSGTTLPARSCTTAGRCC